MTGASGAELLLAGAAGLLITLFLIHAASFVAPRVGLVDLPDQRKRHSGAVPLVGGIAVSLAYIAVAVTLLPTPERFSGLAIGIGMLMMVGLLDDLMELRPRVRLLTQTAAALLLVFVGGLQVTELGDLAGNGNIVLAPQVAFLFTVFCVVSLINGVNMLDGVDGLAGGLTATSLAGFLVVAALMGSAITAAHIGLMIACIAGFLLFHNLRTPLRRKLVFLGDAGSMVLGFTLAWTAIALANQPGEPAYPMSAVWILGLVVLDTIATVIRRLLAGRSPLSAGRDHLHHLLLDAGMSPQRVVLVMVSGAAVMAAIGVGGWYLRLPEAWLTGGFVGLSLIYYTALTLGWRRVERRLAEVIPMPVHDVGENAVQDTMKRKAG